MSNHKLRVATDGYVTTPPTVRELFSPHVRDFGKDVKQWLHWMNDTECAWLADELLRIRNDVLASRENVTVKPAPGQEDITQGDVFCSVSSKH